MALYFAQVPFRWTLQASKHLDDLTRRDDTHPAAHPDYSLEANAVGSARNGTWLFGEVLLKRPTLDLLVMTPAPQDQKYTGIIAYLRDLGLLDNSYRAHAEATQIRQVNSVNLYFQAQGTPAALGLLKTEVRNYVARSGLAPESVEFSPADDNNYEPAHVFQLGPIILGRRHRFYGSVNGNPLALWGLYQTLDQHPEVKLLIRTFTYELHPGAAADPAALLGAVPGAPAAAAAGPPAGP
ncbi:hypothetical protein HYY74_05930 [Candidatus Woesearchaeota archaeon]|nr:hypothetical protein [Candidatus Woesearchaeota archaeon]